jgi:hypothetical protein
VEGFKTQTRVSSKGTSLPLGTHPSSVVGPGI